MVLHRNGGVIINSIAFVDEHPAELVILYRRGPQAGVKPAKFIKDVLPYRSKPCQEYRHDLLSGPPTAHHERLEFCGKSRVRRLHVILPPEYRDRPVAFKFII